MARNAAYKVGELVIAPGHTAWTVQEVVSVARRWGMWRYTITGCGDLELYENQLYPPSQTAELQARLNGPPKKG